MNKKMLIDASYKEETRVVILNNNNLEEYDVESSTKKQLKGNIYLAKIIRIEPSLQAAFVDYGGNRHGFLAFSEIHPDYYQIPIADRKELLDLQQRIQENLPEEDVNGNIDDNEESEPVAQFLRNYKIQEVIHRRQILLVQVVKEERGNKGAALTTYLSLAGRYCVLMPNSLRSGGISRKITSISERNRLKDIIQELNIPAHMGMIIRTAGAQCPKADTLKDGEYLLHLWDEIRDRTMKAMAPTLIYEDSNLLKRAIRDNYTSDINEILIDGEDGWNIARDYMRSLMPQNLRKLHLWRDQKQSLFSHYKVEDLLNQMLSPIVQLKSGGYLVINQTEALVAIDVNSGRSIKEKDLEETALRTNQEAADEIVKQLRLRDLAGLIVIDFIDMENKKHNYMIERRLKSGLHKDRARMQIGSISSFGLLEMTRQRLRPSLTEFAFIPCPHCNGIGIIRSEDNTAVHILRQIDEETRRIKPGTLTVQINSHEIALYILNQQRSWLHDIERKRKVKITFNVNTSLKSTEVLFSNEVDPSIEIDIEPEIEQNESIDLALEKAPFIREIPIHSQQEETEYSEEKDFRNRRNRYRRTRPYQQNNVNDEENTVDTITVDSQSAVHPIVAINDEQPDVPFHPVLDQEEYTPSKWDNKNRRTNRFQRNSRWKRNRSQYNNQSNPEQEQTIDIENTTNVVTNEVLLPSPTVNTVPNNTPAFIAVDISENQFEKTEPTQKASHFNAPPEAVHETSDLEVENSTKAKRKTTTKKQPTKRKSPVKKVKEKITDVEIVLNATSPSEIKTDINISPTTEVAEDKPKKVVRKRAATTKKAATSTEEKKTKTTVKKATTTRARKPKATAKDVDADTNTTPIVQPIVIDDAAPAATPRAGWWKR